LRSSISSGSSPKVQSVMRSGGAGAAGGGTTSAFTPRPAAAAGAAGGAPALPRLQLQRRQRLEGTARLAAQLGLQAGQVAARCPAGGHVRRRCGSS
jgi:hypothetical protein